MNHSKKRNFLKVALAFLLVLAMAACLAGCLYFLRLSKTDSLTENKTVAAEEAAVPHTELTPYEQIADDMELLQKYQEYNGDVVGLIRIPDTCLNHPVVHTPEEEDYYLSRDLDKNYNSHGVPLLSAESDIECRYGNIIIYGHNIHKKTRDVFADLAGYEELDFYKEHPIVETVTEKGTRKWLIFAYFITDNADEEPFRYSDYVSFRTKQDLEEYMEQVKMRNWLDVPVTVGMEDVFLTLSSCSNELAGSGTNRMVVMAKQLMSGEEYKSMVDNALMAEAPLLPSKLQ